MSTGLGHCASRVAGAGADIVAISAHVDTDGGEVARAVRALGRDCTALRADFADRARESRLGAGQRLDPGNQGGRRDAARRDQADRGLEVAPFIEAGADQGQLPPEEPVQAQLARDGMDSDLDEAAANGQCVHRSGYGRCRPGHLEGQRGPGAACPLGERRRCRRVGRIVGGEIELAG
ncbi:MAG TPA: hypothetical protein VFI65_19630 [Streptosporangiaceae bacterium]|nr:hypothetical protein [Streptosporangiaceae bacterium]